MIRLLRKALPYLLVAVVAAGAYDTWIFYSRSRKAQETEQRTKAKAAEDARRTIDMLGGGQLKILSFYASPGAIRRGEKTNLCYGVYGAKSVRLEPPIEELHPAVAHCLQVSPATTTEYKLVADDGAGHSASQSVVLQVGR